jgi:heme exporter protein A
MMSSDQPRTLLAIDRVTLVRGGRTLFEDLDLVLGPGDGVVITGANGCGKSSLIRLAAGLLEPSVGRIDRTAVALADDALALDRERPLGKALAFWGGARLTEAMAAFDLDRLSEVPVRLLSTGQARRARLARVLASGAGLWLLDEPLSGLDRDGVTQLDAAVGAHRARGGAVLAASHVPLGGTWRELAL